tara:strand:+ start:374 stop:559 length:186 start_codon:yes stop_codon:yes gene_type:complete
MNPSMIQSIFDGCVDLLNWMADLFGCTYEEVNVILFCFVGPMAFLALLADNLRLRRKFSRR